jgi:hypothetical protein
MWRPARGATSSPGPCRPAGGYGRALGRPGPRVEEPRADEPLKEAVDVLDPSVFALLIQLEEVVDLHVDAPVTP